MPIIVAIALICGVESCENKVQEPRFESLAACNSYLSSERMRLASQGQQVVLDDCIVTTDQRIKEFK
jgi:hypothetical protein